MHINSTPYELTNYLAQQVQKQTLRLITCGSVDDGKSTLLGRMLFETQAIFDDQLAALEKDSKQFGTQGENIDLALLVDGLQAEREQGITIDVAYRFFASEKRRYIVADTPGHTQYTRNMATGASTADCAIILIDARKGVLTQTRRHTRIAAMMGIGHIVVAVNKMDLVGFSQDIFQQIVADYCEFAKTFEFESIHPIPVSGLAGDNVVRPSPHTPWYEGPSLMAYLDSLEGQGSEQNLGFRLAVQYVNRPNLDFRGFCGRLNQGTVSEGEKIRVLPSGVESTVAKIYLGFETVEQVVPEQSVTLTLSDEVDISRGDVLVSANHPAQVADQFSATLLWLNEQSMTPGRQYWLKLGTKEVSASITEIKYLEDINTGQHLAAKQLALNDIASITLSTSSPIVFEPYPQNRQMGAFVLIDKLSFQTVGAGMLNFALRRADNIHWQNLEVNQQARAELKRQHPKCLWMTGLSGSGKSTLANALEKRLHLEGKHTYILDGDNIRHGLNRDLGFSDEGRVENIRRVAEVAKLMTDAGLIVIVSFISPFIAERRMARELFNDSEFIEVFVDTPLETCEARDVKGLYAKARAGRLPNFTGIDSPYEVPVQPEVHLKTSQKTIEESVDALIKLIEQ